LTHVRTRRLRTVGAIAALLLLLTACGGDDDVPQDTGAEAEEETGGEEAASLEVSAVDNSFDPSSLSAAAGSEVTVEVTNDGSNPHTFTIDDLEVDTETIASGESASATFTMPDSSVSFYCAIHGEAVMSGTIEAT
jgi:plastocyanin